MTRHLPQRRDFRWTAIACALAAVLALCSIAHADQRIVLKSGIALEGLFAEIASLNENPFDAGGRGQPKSRPILLVDDGLRRVYIHERGMVAGPPQDVRGIERTIEFKQSVPLGGSPIQGIGDILGVSDFNEYGRRTITIRGPTGEAIDIVQGITELNSRYAKVEALKARPSYVWDMRVATSTIMSDTLQNIFRQRIDQSDVNERLTVVRFFIEAERFRAAEEELTRTIRAFPELKDMKTQLIGIVNRQANQLIDEAALRASVGQEQYARSVYQRFPMNAVGRITREKVKIAVEKLSETDRQVKELVDALRADLEQLPEGQRESLQSVFSEIEKGLSSATLPRLNDYSRLRKSDTVSLDERVALAVAGWLMGPGSGEQNLVVATSLVKVRDLVAEYLGPADLIRRPQILEELRTIEGAQIEYVARLLPQLLPVKSWPEGSADPDIPGLFWIGGTADTDAAEQSLIDTPDYLVQLPPEYDPLREYPCLVVLAPPGAPPELELAWWAGDFDPSLNARIGHATRNGYIVVAPKWGRDTQRTYEYTPREHHAVLSSLRHAMRRASIDADRVFLAGHGDGATAAWDIALSHPDHWAGMISINGEPSKTIQHYFPNAEHIPLYFVMGEASGPKPPLIRMGAVLDDYMNVRNDATVVMYRGRAREDFYEEIPKLFEWMNVATHVRKPMPQDIDARTMRKGDQYFWWLELGPLKPLVEINPVLWEQAERKRAGVVDASIGGGNQIRMDGPCDSYMLCLRPDMGIDLNEQVVIRRSRDRVPDYFRFDGELETILEDTRRRADRKRPFWARIPVPLND
ncbi:alpha/beta hydrolase [Stieleria mannarensis]|uniref:carboxylesterase family protein n=1 Tax=Stieleria mannarensis TaxID=2755585 RepID=UPI001602ACED|nr:alpha/beta hydrolase [Rhodopirellula sp. JC639]